MKNNPLPRFWALMNPAERKQIVDMMVENMYWQLDWIGSFWEDRIRELHEASEANSLEARIARVKSDFRMG